MGALTLPLGLATQRAVERRVVAKVEADGGGLEQVAERQDYQGEERVTFTLAPHAPYTVSDDTFRKIVTTAEQADMLVHCHIHETAGEVADSLRDHGVRPLARLAGLGLLSPRLTAAHMVHVDDSDLEQAARYGISVAHNPTSNM